MIGSFKEAIGFCCDPLPDNDGYTWSLTTYLGKFLREAQQKYGPRDPAWTPLGIEFCGDTPRLWYPGNASHISIMLTDAARANPKRALFQLAHEVIHLLSPSGGRHANVLEEGLATLNSHFVSREMGLGFFSDVPSYLVAENLVIKLLETNSDVVRQMRVREPKLLNFNTNLIREFAPSLPVEIANELCCPFVRNSMDLGSITSPNA
jgi:hypothetical protein